MRSNPHTEAAPMKIHPFSGLKFRWQATALALLVGLAAVFVASTGLAQDMSPVADAAVAIEQVVAAEAAPAEEATAPAFDSGNVAWMLTSTLLVLLMVVPGLALFYGGMVRSKNVLSVLMQVLVVFSAVIILWIAYGYSAAFTGGNNFF